MEKEENKNFKTTHKKIAQYLIDYMMVSDTKYIPMSLGYVKNFDEEKMRSYPTFYYLLKDEEDAGILSELLKPIFLDYKNITLWFRNFQKITKKLFFVMEFKKHHYLHIDYNKLKQFQKDLQKENVKKEPPPYSLSFNDRYSYDHDFINIDDFINSCNTLKKRKESEITNNKIDMAFKINQMYENGLITFDKARQFLSIL